MHLGAVSFIIASIILLFWVTASIVERVSTRSANAKRDKRREDAERKCSVFNSKFVDVELENRLRVVASNIMLVQHREFREELENTWPSYSKDQKAMPSIGAKNILRILMANRGKVIEYDSMWGIPIVESWKRVGNTMADNRDEFRYFVWSITEHLKSYGYEGDVYATDNLLSCGEKRITKISGDARLESELTVPYAYFMWGHTIADMQS